MVERSDLLVSTLENEEVKWISAISGKEDLGVLASLRNSRIELVLTCHDQTAAFMAAAYGRWTRILANIPRGREACATMPMTIVAPTTFSELVRRQFSPCLPLKFKQNPLFLHPLAAWHGSCPSLYGGGSPRQSSNGQTTAQGAYP
ncbi:hypothetical protein F4V91_31780 [Neorhizobium galegae]|uniref:Thiamine pyrophosphate enzyme N-terminal TPP-binding domain-containing protein n=1 Tax=Neorhizobium galegae TaxID=399 RepID=A0A6A1TQ42_NEOGA|nr:hypothetical protein F4V91_31470 [Neorhizobium galegae]KAB1084066.1 hypothetical protein F4V91_31475 [Neorhizobium galegae]KAB1084069.1 hypothetical protein F4V91_31775 [Neorhizobium galegae]KAB1084070.1 hypothetical protein F4V91_31780 [Neorhizobium galegae]